MMKALCGLDCGVCDFRSQCKGCGETGGRPFGGSCLIGECCKKNGCADSCRAHEKEGEKPLCGLKRQLVEEFNALGIEDMEKVTDMNALAGSYINLTYTLPGGQKIKFWDDNRVYLGNQIRKKNSHRCYGLTADENYLLVCEYGDEGSDPEIVVFQRRKT